MTRSSDSPGESSFLGIECGATRTVAVLANAAGQQMQRMEAGPANLKLLTEPQLLLHFQTIAKTFPLPTTLGIGMAGARSEPDWKRIREAAEKVWPQIPCYATSDLETALAAGRMQNVEGSRRKTKDRSPSNSSFRSLHSAFPQVLVLSGTGSCCYGRNAAGEIAKIGGWGHILGDKGSGFEIGLRALKAVVFYYDYDGVWPKLGGQLLQSLQLNEPSDLIGWVYSASKADIAALAVEVFKAWEKGDKIAGDILAGTAHSLAADAAACAARLTASASSRRRLQAPVQFILAGSVLLKQPRFAGKVSAELRKLWPEAIVTPLQRESVWGAVELARETFHESKVQSPKSKVGRRTLKRESDTEMLKLSPTEQRNLRSLNLDKMSVAEAIRLFLSEDAKIPKSLLAERKRIEQAVKWIARAFQQGGRLFYIGAGTSGRLGVLDASECPPTFRTPPELVQAIMAGGQTALWKAVEGAEDDFAAGARAVEFRGVDRLDVVVGIAASGRTPYVWGALGEAKRRGAKAILLCFNPFLKITGAARPSLIIAPNVGPELLTGSTRLKAGTATKLVLNIFTTLAMVRIGKVAGNLMVDLNPSNVKLRDRAVRIVQELKGVDYVTAQRALKKAGWVVKKALANLRRK